MSPLPHNNESLNDTTVQTTHSENLIVKAYSNLLSNKAVQTGIKQLSIISQPLIEKFDHRLVRLANKAKRIVARDNIYNHLSTIWLSHTLPFNGTVVSFETFAQEYKAYFRKHNRQQNPKTLNIYYQFACESWSTLNEPTTEDIKNTILLIAARTINKAFHFEGETLSNTLNNTFRTLIEKRGQLVSNESFLKLVKTALGEDFINKNYQTVNAPCEQFYTFAKRFIVLDFPLATENNKDVVKLVKNFIHENSFYYGDSALDFVEKYLNTITHIVGQQEGEFAQDTTITEKAQRVLKKAINLSTFSAKKLESTLHQLQGTETYVYLDTHLHLNDKIDQAILLGTKGYQLLRENILTPSLNSFELVRNKTRDQVTLIVHNLDVQLLKKNYAQLRAKYEVLQRCAVIIAGETVNLVFDKKNLAEFSEKGKKELFRIYQELKTLETQKVVELSLEYYAAILKKAKQTYSVASQSVDTQKKVAVEQESTEAKPVENESEKNSPSTNAGEKEASGSSEEESH